MTFILWLVFWYVLAGLGFYTYAVVKSFEILGFWSFKITDRFIGIAEYPKWLLFWLYWIVKKLRRV